MPNHPDIVIYRAPATRSFSVLWLLEELGVAYRSEIVASGIGVAKSAEYLRLNPSGMVPTVVDGDVVIRECPAICIYLADRYGYGSLAPRIDDPERGPYLSWLIYATAQLEAARATQHVAIPLKKGNWGAGWQALPQVVDILTAALARNLYLLGDRFTAADVMMGATIAMGLYTKEIPNVPALVSYAERLQGRSACKTAMALNWGS